MNENNIFNLLDLDEVAKITPKISPILEFVEGKMDEFMEVESSFKDLLKQEIKRRECNALMFMGEAAILQRLSEVPALSLHAAIRFCLEYARFEIDDTIVNDVLDHCEELYADDDSVEYDLPKDACERIRLIQSVLRSWQIENSKALRAMKEELE